MTASPKGRRTLSFLLTAFISVGCSGDKPVEGTVSGLLAPTDEAARALTALPEAPVIESLIAPLILAVGATALDGTTFGLAPRRGIRFAMRRITAPSPIRPLLLCPHSCPKATVDGEACRGGDVLFPAPARDSGLGITFDQTITLDWGEGCADEENGVPVAGKMTLSYTLSGIGLLLSDDPDEIDLTIDSEIDVRYGADEATLLRAGLRGVFAGRKREDGAGFSGSGGLAADVAIQTDLAPPTDTEAIYLTIDETLAIEKRQDDSGKVRSGQVSGRAQIASPSMGRIDAVIEDVTRLWGFEGSGIVGCLDEPVAGRILIEAPRGDTKIDFDDDLCDCKARGAGSGFEGSVQACDSEPGDLLAEVLRYLVKPANPPWRADHRTKRLLPGRTQP